MFMDLCLNLRRRQRSYLLEVLLQNCLQELYMLLKIRALCSTLLHADVDVVRLLLNDSSRSKSKRLRCWHDLFRALSLVILRKTPCCNLKSDADVPMGYFLTRVSFKQLRKTLQKKSDREYGVWCYAL